MEEIFFKPSTNLSSNHCNHCAPDSEHIPRTILAFPWIQSDNNNNNNNNDNNNNNNNDNSAIFVKSLYTYAKSPELLSSTRNITDGTI